MHMYGAAGEHVHTLAVPANGSRIADIAWDGNGAQLAIIIGSHVYFAVVRPQHLWSCYSDIHVR